MIRHDMPFDAYLAHPAVSKSLLDLFERAPKLARMQMNGEYHRDETPAMRMGSLVHCMVLEPGKVEDRYAVAHEIDRRTKEGKLHYQEFLDQARGKTVVTPDDMHAARMASESVRAHPMAQAILATGSPEVSVFAPLDGVDCKGRIDWLRGDGIIADLKTTRDATPSGFGRSAASFDYPVQAAMYLDLIEMSGYDADEFVFVAVETTDPYLCATYSLTKEDLKRGRAMYRNRLVAFRRCKESNTWPGIGHDLITQLALPAWWGYGIEEQTND